MKQEQWKEGSFELTNKCAWENMAVCGLNNYYNVIELPTGLGSDETALTRRARSAVKETDKIIKRLIGETVD